MIQEMISNSNPAGLMRPSTVSHLGVDSSAAIADHVVAIDLTDDFQLDAASETSDQAACASPACCKGAAGRTKQQMLEAFQALQKARATGSEEQWVIDEIISATGNGSLQEAIAQHE